MSVNGFVMQFALLRRNLDYFFSPLAKFLIIRTQTRNSQEGRSKEDLLMKALARVLLKVNIEYR